MGFGKCKMNNENGICQGYMNLACSWQTMTGVSRMMESINGSAAITLDSVLLCRRGELLYLKHLDKECLKPLTGTII